MRSRGSAGVMRSVIELAPPPAHGRRLQDLGDRLIVSFRPRRSWFDVAFLSFWFVCWTLGGVLAAAQVPKVSPAGAAFVLLWLCGWVIGEVFSAGNVAWQLVGREELSLSADELVVRKRVGPFARRKTYDVASMHHVRAVPVPYDEDEDVPRSDFCLRMVHATDVFDVGECMSEREADYVAATVAGRLERTSWWDSGKAAEPCSPRREVVLSAGRFAFVQPDRSTINVVVGGAVACVNLAARSSHCCSAGVTRDSGPFRARRPSNHRRAANLRPARPLSAARVRVHPR
jgi:hypothetical protein